MSWAIYPAGSVMRMGGTQGGMGIVSSLSPSFTPASLTPLAWFEPALSTPGQTLTDQRGGTAATLGSTAGVDANDPDWSTPNKLVLDGVNRFVQVPTGAMPAMTVGAEWTVVVVGKQPASPVSYGRWVSTKASANAAGLIVINDLATRKLWAEIRDTTTAVNFQAAPITFATGDLVCFAVWCSAETMYQRLNTTTSTGASVAALGNRTGTTPRIGINANSGNPQALDFYGLVTASRVLTTTELDNLFAYFAGKYA